MMMRRSALRRETLESRLPNAIDQALLFAELPAACRLEQERRDDAAVVAVADVAPQFVVHQPPRLQPGNLPLAGTPADDGFDRIDLLWQTRTVGPGTQDDFQVSFRAADASQWTYVSLQPVLDTGEDTRQIHAATLRRLDWERLYLYRVEHRRAGTILATYEAEFRTRLRRGDDTPFTFVAYGDSAAPGTLGDGFRAVQSRIVQVDPAFVTLLGDNIYEFGTHVEADARFTTEQNPAATEWTAGHVDYFAIGNHDAIINFHGGQPSRDSYAVPLPVAGVNAWAAPSAGEFPEHNYSWDYGNVHFVVIDTNVVELPATPESRARTEAVLDYVVADLRASDARWKVVITHHPLLGSEKTYDSAGGFYFQAALPRLRAAGADLLLVGDSHTYSWTYPIQDASDADGDGQIREDEVQFWSGTGRDYPQGAGLVQTIAGVGGRSLRSHSYPDPFIASSYSTHPATGPIEYGFAQIDVTPDALTVSYISAATGQIVGDTNGNGQADSDEPYFGQFRILATRRMADFNRDGQLDAFDFDLLCAAVLDRDDRAEFDLNLDGTLDLFDYDWLIDSIASARRGDANLDGTANSKDLVLIFVAGKYEQDLSAGWAEGDWNCDGRFTTQDLVLLMMGGYAS